MTPDECLKHARSLGLGSRRKDERLLAESAIRAMGDEAVPFLLRTLEAAGNTERLLRRIEVGTRLAGVVVVNLLLTFCAKRMGLSADWRYALSKLSIIVTFAVVAALIMSNDWDTQPAAQRLLLELADVRAVNALLESRQRGADRQSADAAISRLLRRAAASDGPLFSDSSRKRLVAVLARISSGKGSFAPNEIEFGLAVLQCLEQIGEPRALEAVARIARGDRLPSAALPIRNAAREALPAFERAAEADRIAGTLLRAVGSPSSGVLLRPASASQTGEDSVLVRPVERDREG